MLRYPLKDRGSSSSEPAAVICSGDSRPSKYKSWDEERLHLAVVNDGISVRQSSTEYNVCTLHDRINRMCCIWIPQWTNQIFE